MLLNFKHKKSFSKTYFILFCLLAFSIPLSRAGISLSIILLFLTWIIEGNFKEKLTLLKNITFIKVTAAFFLFMILSLLWTEDIPEGLHTLRLYSYWLIIPIIITSLEKKYIPVVINTFLIAMLISEILTYGVYFELWSIKGATKSAPTIFMTHISYSILLAITTILLLNRIFLSSSKKSVKAFSLLFLITVLGNLFISNGRTGLVALLIATVILIFIHYKKSIKKIFITLLTALVLLITAYLSIDNFNHRINATVKDVTTISEKNFDSSIGIRLSFWLITKDIFLKHPLIGVGIGDSLTASYAEYSKNNYNFAPHVIEFAEGSHFHNIYIQTLVQTGIIGLLLVFIIFYTLAKLKIQNQEYHILALMFTIIYFIGSFAEPLWYKQTVLALFILFTGIFLKLAEEESKL